MNIPDRVKRIAEDIKSMRIRGAGRIARAAAEALKIAAEEYRGAESEFAKYMEQVGEYLVSTRPTAVSLPNAVTMVLARLRSRGTASLEEQVNLVVSAATEFIEYSRTAVKKIGEIGARRILDGETVLTHCNSSAAISILVEAHRMGRNIRVYATETRPRFQGHLTAASLCREGLDVTLIPDSAVRYVMKSVDKVVVGADTVTANGAVVNKIGTSQIALAAHEARVRVFVAAETYKFSPRTVLGELVVVEEREPSEVVAEEYLRAHAGVKIRNPAFDVTPPEYIDAIITELGVIPPQAAILVLRDVIGWSIEEIHGREELMPSEEDEPWEE